MMGLILAIHIIICLLLVGIILIQAGRGGGLVENFSGVESMFGTKTNAFLTRATTVLSILFFITCLGLAVLSARQGRSLLKGAPQSMLSETNQTAAVKPTTPLEKEAVAPEATNQDKSIPGVKPSQEAP